MWILLSRPRGALSDRRGLRTVLLAKVGGFMLACRAMRILLIVSLRALPAAGPVFAGLLVSREAVGAFFAAIPAEGQTPVADHVAPGEHRRHGLAWRGRWRWTVAGPALAAAPAQTVGFFAIDRLQLKPEQPPGPHGFAGCRAQASTQSARRCLGRFCATRAGRSWRIDAQSAAREPPPLRSVVKPRFRFWGEAAARRKKKSACSADFFSFSGRIAARGRPAESA